MANPKSVPDERPLDERAVAALMRREARIREARRRKNRLFRHRMRLVDDIIERLLGRRLSRPTKKLQEQVLLSEGGNQFKDSNGTPLTRRIKKEEIEPTVKWLETVTKLDLHGGKSPQDGLPLHWLGSTGRKSDNGDLDLLVNQNTVTKEKLIEVLTKWVNKQPATPNIPKYITKSGISIHFLTPIKGDAKNGYVQTDFMFVSNPAWSHFSMHAPTNSSYKGADRAQLLNSMAKALGYKLNASEGIKDRETEEVISDNPDAVAKLLLNPKATRKDLASVETMLAALENDPKREDKLVAFRGFIGKSGRTVD